MFKKSRILVLCGLMVLLMACNCNLLNLIKGAVTGSGEDSANGGGTSPFSLGSNDNQTQNGKKFDGELKIIDQVFAVKKDVLSFAILVENTSSKLTVSEFTQTGNVKDSAGADVPLLNLDNGNTKSLDVITSIFPNQKGLICMNYEIPEGTSVGDVSFSFADIKAVDVGLENPIKADGIGLGSDDEEVYFDDNGVITATVTNSSSLDVVFPQFQAGVYDAAGDLIGCGSQFDSVMFLKAGFSLPIEFPVWTNGQSSSAVEVYATPRFNQGKIYTDAEPIQISDVGFIQEGIYVYPVYKLTNTLTDKAITRFLVNQIAYDQNNQVLLVSSFGTDGIPPQMSVGPYHDQMGQVGESVVSRLEVQVHTTEVKEPKTPITADSVVFSPGVFVPGDYKITTTATNNTDAALSGAVQAACIDASGKVTGLAQSFFDLPPKSDTPLELSGGYVGFYETGPNCSPEDKIEFNLLKIYEW